MPRLSLSRFSLAATVLFMAGCAVGPDFKAPDAPEVTTYDSTPAANTTTDGNQQLQDGQDIPSQWWSLFHSQGLDELVKQAIRDNPDLAAADATLRVAQDNLSAGSSQLFPTVSGSFSSQREKVAGASYGGDFPSTIYTLHNATVSVSYGLDVFGGTRRAIEELQAQADYAHFQKEASYLTLTSNVVTAAIQEASLREQIAATQAIIEEQEKTLKVLNARFDAGAVPKSSITEQQTTVATTKATLPALDHQLAVTRHLLSILVGQMPQNQPEAVFKLAELTLPAQIPLSIPSKLVEQRPDIRMAEENLHAASAAIGVAEAARLPQIALSADIGSVGNIISKLFTPGSGMWDIAGSATQTLFDAGALADKEQAARDNYLAAAAQYRSTVLTAFQNVADTLHALQSDSDALNAKMEADKAAKESLSLAQTQLKAGSITTVEVLTTEQAEEQTAVALAQARAQRYADTAALFVALGGGWWNRDSKGLIIGNDILVSPELLKGVQ